MASYRQNYHHIVFGTYSHRKTIPNSHCELLYKYIWGIIKNKNCFLYRINGVEDHIHILTDLHPSIALADFIKEIKRVSSKWIKHQTGFNHFEGWAEGYGSFTVSHQNKNRVIEYIKSQKTHHQKESFNDEYRRLLVENGIDVKDLL